MSDADRLAALADAFLAAPTQSARDALSGFLEGFDAGFLDLDERLTRVSSDGWTSHGLIVRPQAELTVFLLRAGAEIPIHDHPGLHGWMCLLRGRLQLTAWDWTDREAGLARPVQRAEFAVGDSIPVIGPERCAVHRVEALEDSVFLDLFVPPYSPPGCTYYQDGGPGPDGTVRLVPRQTLG